MLLFLGIDKHIPEYEDNDLKRWEQLVAKQFIKHVDEAHKEENKTDDKAEIWDKLVQYVDTKWPSKSDKV
jgi:hypothetical protein